MDKTPFVEDPLKHIGLVVKIARRLGVRPIADSIEFTDGIIGLLLACVKYKPNYISAKTGQPIKFSTYAAYWITQSIKKNNIALRYQKRGGVGVGVTRATPINTIVFSALSALPSGMSREDPAVDCGPSPLDAASAGERVDLCRRLLKSLDARAATIMLKYFGDDMPFTEIGASLDPPISRERVRQIVDKSLAKLRDVARRYANGHQH